MPSKIVVHILRRPSLALIGSFQCPSMARFLDRSNDRPACPAACLIACPCRVHSCPCPIAPLTRPFPARDTFPRRAHARLSRAHCVSLPRACPCPYCRAGSLIVAACIPAPTAAPAAPNLAPLPRAFLPAFPRAFFGHCRVHSCPHSNDPLTGGCNPLRSAGGIGGGQPLRFCRGFKVQFLGVIRPIRGGYPRGKANERSSSGILTSS